MTRVCGVTDKQADKCWNYDGDAPDIARCEENSCACAAGYFPFRGLCTTAAGPPDRVQQIHEYCAGKWCTNNAELECCLSLGTWHLISETPFRGTALGFKFRDTDLKLIGVTSGGLADKAGLANYMDYDIVRMQAHGISNLDTYEKQEKHLSDGDTLVLTVRNKEGENRYRNYQQYGERCSKCLYGDGGVWCGFGDTQIDCGTNVLITKSNTCEVVGTAVSCTGAETNAKSFTTPFANPNEDALCCLGVDGDWTRLRTLAQLKRFFKVEGIMESGAEATLSNSTTDISKLDKLEGEVKHVAEEVKDELEKDLGINKACQLDDGTFRSLTPGEQCSISLGVNPGYLGFYASYGTMRVAGVKPGKKAEASGLGRYIGHQVLMNGNEVNRKQCPGCDSWEEYDNIMAKITAAKEPLVFTVKATPMLCSTPGSTIWHCNSPRNPCVDDKWSCPTGHQFKSDNTIPAPYLESNFKTECCV
jgi:hypothetical protein